VCYVILVNRPFETEIAGKKLFFQKDDVLLTDNISQSFFLRHGFAPIFPDTCYHLTHYWPAAADIPVASDNPVHY
ncbi:hypothetical protein ACJQUU_005955, partial [Escherichia coli]